MPDVEQMLKRQTVLADFGELALRSEDLQEILTEACRLVGKALKTDYAKILEIDHRRQDLLVKAGFGWKDGVIGHVRLPFGERSSETYSINQGIPVVTQAIKDEERFDFPAFMMEHGVIAIVNVPIFLPGGRAYGLLQVDSRLPRDFAQDDIEFLRTYASILGPVIDRLHKVHDLQIALETNRHLLQELQHRIKNHIGTIMGIVNMRRRETKSEEAREELVSIGERIEALRLIYEQLYVAGAAERLRMAPYITQLLKSLCQIHHEQTGKVHLNLVLEDIELGPNQAVPLGLILNEFATNSMKHAFDGRGGKLSVAIDTMDAGVIRVRISDDGKGLPQEPRPTTPGSGAGMKLMAGLAYQMGAKLDWSRPPGTTLSLEFCPV